MLNISSGGTVCQLDAGPVGKLYTSDHAVVSSCVASGSGAAISIFSSSYIGSLLKDCAGIDSGCLYVRGSGIAGSNLGVSGVRAGQLYIWEPAQGEIVSAVNCSAIGGTIQVHSGGFLESGYCVSNGLCFIAGGVVSNYSVYG